jgi:hypothetical protein
MVLFWWCSFCFLSLVWFLKALQQAPDQGTKQPGPKERSKGGPEGKVNFQVCGAAGLLAGVHESFGG